MKWRERQGEKEHNNVCCMCERGCVLVLRHIDLDCSHLEKREQQLAEETSRRAVHFIGKKDQLTRELEDVEVMGIVMWMLM